MSERDWQRDKATFLANCFRIVTERGEEVDCAIGVHGAALQYEDEIISISRSKANKEMEVRKLENLNPVIMTHEDGTTYRYHGEWADLEDHVNGLIANLARDELADSLRTGFESIIKEADEWRPLASHVLDLIQHKVNILRRELEIAQGFHDVAVKERDLERLRNDRLHDWIDDAMHRPECELTQHDDGSVCTCKPRRPTL